MAAGGAVEVPSAGIAGRIGFCCKWLDPDPGGPAKARAARLAAMNQRDTTLERLRGMDRAGAAALVSGIVSHNCAALRRQLGWIATLPPALRMFRVTSRMVPAEGVPGFEALHEAAGTEAILREGLRGVRADADAWGIRLCMHPGQYSNLCSPDEGVVERAVADIERHVHLARLMGYGEGWHESGFAVNVHANIGQDPGLRRFRDAVERRLSAAARGMITVENDEFGCGLDEILDSGVHERVPVVLDVHHHWIRSCGEYIRPGDSRLDRVRASWRGVRPLAHASTTAESVLPGHDPGRLPDYGALRAAGIRRTDLRKHAHSCWNLAVNDRCIEHLSWADLEVESKGKNLASAQLFAHASAARRGVGAHPAAA